MASQQTKIRFIDTWVSISTNVFVIASVLFLAYEIQQNNRYLRRSEVNATMDQVSIIRMAIMDREIAELLVRARQAPASLDPADRFRVNSYFGQVFWTSWQIYDRERGGYVDPGEWERAGRGLVLSILALEAGRNWWNGGSTSGMPPDFVELVNESAAAAAAAGAGG